MSEGADTKEIELNGHKLFIRKFEPFHGLRVIGALQARFLIPFAVSMRMQTAPTEDLAVEAVTKAARELSNNIGGENLVEIAKLLIDPTYIGIKVRGQGDAKRLDEGMINLNLELADLLDLCKASLLFNFLDFGKRAAILFGEARGAQLAQNSPA